MLMNESTPTNYMYDFTPEAAAARQVTGADGTVYPSEGAREFAEGLATLPDRVESQSGPIFADITELEDNEFVRF